MILDRMAQAPLRADVSWHELDDRWYSSDPGSLASSSTFAGFPIGPETAKRVSAVFACNAKIAEIIASTPSNLLRRLDNGGKEKATDHPAFRTIRYQPNSWLTAMDFYGGEQMRLGLRGNCYSEIRRRGRAVELWPIHPTLVTVEQLATGRLRYQVRDPKNGSTRTLLQDEVLHVRDLYEDGLMGQGRAVLAREAIAVAAAGEAFVGHVFKNDATGRLIFEHPGTPNKQQREEFEENLRAKYSGWQNARKPLIAYGGMKPHEVGGLGEGDFLVDPRKFQVSDVARYWGVPLWLIGMEEKTSSWGSGVEQMFIAFVNLTIKAWADRWSQAMMMALLDEDEQEEFVIEFNFNDLVRGDIKSRFQAYQIGRTIGMYSPNELRVKENESPREGGDEFQETPTGAAPNAEPPPKSRRPAPPDDEDEEAHALPAPLVADAARRMATAEARDILARMPGDTGKRGAWLRKAYTEKRAYNRTVLAPLAEIVGARAGTLELALDEIEASGLAAIREGDAGTWCTVRQRELDALLSSTLTRRLALAA